MKIEKEVINYLVEEAEFDGLTLLSEEEYEQYKDNIELIESFWWLRSHGISCNYTALVDRDGDIDTYGCCVDYPCNSIRPALIIKSHNLSIGDKFKLYNHNWTVISDQYALCDKTFCRMAFREDRCAINANYYPASDIKKYLDEQFEEMKNEN